MSRPTQTPTSESPVSESLVDRLRQRGAVSQSPSNTQPITTESDDADSPLDLGTFGWLRGVKDQAVMLELRLRTGNIVAINYAYLERADYDPSEGITLHIGGGKTVRIEGANLNTPGLNTPSAANARLYEGIVRKRVPWVCESTTGVTTFGQDVGARIVSITF